MANDVWSSLESLINTGAKAYTSVKGAEAASRTKSSPGSPDGRRYGNAIPGDFSSYPQNDSAPSPSFVNMIGRNQSGIVMALVALLGLLLVLRFARS